MLASPSDVLDAASPIAEELAALNALHVPLAQLVNFFRCPNEAGRKDPPGTKVHRRYLMAQTPYHRLLASQHLSADAKANLMRRDRELKPVELARTISRLQARLVEVSGTKQKRKEVRRPGPDHPWKRTSPVRQQGPLRGQLESPNAIKACRESEVASAAELQAGRPRPACAASRAYWRSRHTQAPRDRQSR